MPSSWINLMHQKSSKYLKHSKTKIIKIWLSHQKMLSRSESSACSIMSRELKSKSLRCLRRLGNIWILLQRYSRFSMFNHFTVILIGMSGNFFVFVKPIHIRLFMCNSYDKNHLKSGSSVVLSRHLHVKPCGSHPMLPRFSGSLTCNVNPGLINP